MGMTDKFYAEYSYDPERFLIAALWTNNTMLFGGSRLYLTVRMITGPIGSRIKQNAASLRRIAETETNALTRYRAEQLILIIDNVGEIQTFDIPLTLQTLDAN
jgi:hypothetical protein